MKKLLLTLVCILSFSLVGCDMFTKVKRYPETRSGIVQYKITGVNEGEETLYYDQYGYKEARYTQTVRKVRGIEKKFNMLLLLQNGGEWIYVIDFEEQSGMKMKNPLYDKIKVELRKGGTNVGELKLQFIGAKKIGTDTVAGKPCDVWESQNKKGKACLWKGITLSIHAKEGEHEVNVVATEIEEGVMVPQDKFKIPEGVDIDTVSSKRMLRFLNPSHKPD